MDADSGGDDYDSAFSLCYSMLLVFCKGELKIRSNLPEL